MIYHCHYHLVTFVRESRPGDLLLGVAVDPETTAPQLAVVLVDDVAAVGHQVNTLVQPQPGESLSFCIHIIIILCTYHKSSLSFGITPTLMIRNKNQFVRTATL